MERYRYFLMQLVLVLYMPLMFAVVVYKRLRTDDITPAMQSFSHWKFAFMALLDTLQALLIMVPGGIVPGPLTVLLLQGVVPVTMLASIIFLRYHYRSRHFLGSALVIAGLFVNVMPFLLGIDSRLVAASGANATVISWNCLVYFLSAVPAALSAIYKEHALREEPMDVYYLNAWVAFYQVLIGLLLSPIAYQMESLNRSVPILTNLARLPQNFQQGIACVFSASPSSPQDNCQVALVIVLLFVVASIAYRVLMTVVIKYAGALMAYLSLTMSTAVGYVAVGVFTRSLLSTSRFMLYDVVGLLTVLIGLAVYRSVPEPGAEVLTEEGVLVEEDSPLLHKRRAASSTSSSSSVLLRGVAR
eukprot:PLAT4064.1.p1 GENE.PLAT4064.1~~PLAT4064.1.p1  ORF type:complete len:419 (+),score=134.14 PLAT4064.1:182-1258(+)